MIYFPKLIARIVLGIIAIAMIAMLASCTTYKRCYHKYGSMDSTVVVKVDTIKVVRPVDSIRHIMDTSRHVVIETARTKLVIHRDTIDCMSKADTIHHYVRTVEIREKPVFRDKPAKVAWWVWALVGVAAGLGVAIAIRR